MRVPKLAKISINQGVGKATQEKKLVDDALGQMTAIAGQKAVATMAKKDISNFKLRGGIPIGARVTLRGTKMYEFFDRLIAVTLPRVRDFRGLNPKSFDGRGNYTIGITEQIVFPEIDIDKVSNITGMDITIVTSAPNDQEAYALLEALGMPFKK
jgi:large subunit ribosomal protein L5